MSADNVVHQWAAARGYERKTLPTTSDSWDPVASPVARYLLHLRALGIEDPTKASEFYRNALALRDRSVAFAAKPDEEAAIAERLSRGEVTPTEAAKLLAKAPRPNDALEQVERERRMLSAATRSAYISAVRAVHDFGDRWLTMLRPLVEEAVAAKDDARFAALHDFAGLLRDRDLGALAMVASDPSGTRELDEAGWRHRTARPDRYHLWRVERAEAAQPIFHEFVGPVQFVAASITKAPTPSVADMVAAGMEPTLLSAKEVLDIAHRILIEQEDARELTAATPTPSGHRAVVA